MGNIVNGLIILSMCLFSIDTIKCFLKVYKFEKKNGYRDETICYIKSPYVTQTKRNKLAFSISKWVLKIMIIVLWSLSIYLLLIRDMKFLSILVVFLGYILVVFWYEVYASVNGAKILETGIAHGLDKVDWDMIEEFQFNNKKTKIWDKTFIKIKYHGHYIPKYIEITTENKELVKRLFKEKCAI